MAGWSAADCGQRAVIVSANEATTTVLKAARASGVPLANAEDIATAAPVLLASDGGVAALAKALHGPHAAPQARIDGTQLSIENARFAVALPAALDWIAATGGMAVLTGLDAASLVGPFVSAQGAGVSVSQDGTTIRLTPAEPRPRLEITRRLDLSGPAWDWIVARAAELLVPATEASRDGAGAGTTDND